MKHVVYLSENGGEISMHNRQKKKIKESVF